MKTIELVGYVDEEHQLRVEVPVEVQPGPVKVVIEMVEEDEEAWSRAVAEIWASDWSDPRDDIYSLEDGVPYDGAE